LLAPACNKWPLGAALIVPPARPNSHPLHLEPPPPPPPDRPAGQPEVALPETEASIHNVIKSIVNGRILPLSSARMAHDLRVHLAKQTRPGELARLERRASANLPDICRLAQLRNGGLSRASLDSKLVRQDGDRITTTTTTTTASRQQ